MATPPAISSLEEEIAVLRREKAKLEDDCTEKQAEIEKLTQDIENWNDHDKRRNAAFEAKEADHARDKKRLTSKDAEMRESKEVYENQIKWFENQAKEHQVVLHNTEVELTKSAAETQGLRVTVQELEDERTGADEEITRLKERLKDLQSMNERLQAEKARIIADQEATALVSGGRDRNLNDELAELNELDERGNFSPENPQREWANEQLDDQDDLLPQLGEAKQRPFSFTERDSRQDLDEDVFTRMSFSSISSVAQAPQPKTIKEEPKLDHETSVQPGITSDPAGEQTEHAPQDPLPEQPKPEKRRQSNTGLRLTFPLAWSDTKTVSTPRLLSAVIGTMLLSVLLCFLLWNTAGGSPCTIPYRYTPPHYGSSSFGAYGNGRRILGVIPVGYAPGRNPVHAVLMAVEKVLGIPERRVLM